MREIIRTMLHDWAYVIRRVGEGILLCVEITLDVLSDGAFWYLIGWVLFAVLLLNY